MHVQFLIVPTQHCFALIFSYSQLPCSTPFHSQSYDRPLLSCRVPLDTRVNTG